MLKQYDLPSRQELTVDSVKEVPRIIECISDYFINSQYMALWFDKAGKRCNLISCVNPNRLNLPGSDVSAGKLYVRYPTNTLLARGMSAQLYILIRLFLQQCLIVICLILKLPFLLSLVG